MKPLFSPPHVLFESKPTNRSMPDCDCACTPALPPTPAGAECATIPYHTAPASPIAKHESWQIYHNRLGPAAVVALDPPAQALWETFEVPTGIQPSEMPLQTREVVSALINAGMLRSLTEVTPAIAPSHVLGAWLHVTERCNLGCDYCYLKNKTRDATSEILHGAVDAVMRSVKAHGYTTVHLKYSGGEPLLRLPLLLETHCYAQSQAVRQGRKLEGIVLSNGTLLTSSIVKQLQVANLRLMLSLDGIDKAHDRQRHYPDGHGSFADVARAIELAQSGGLDVTISVTITGRNAPHLPELVAWIVEHDLGFSLNLYRENDLTATDTGLALEEKPIIAGMLAAYKVIEQNLPRRSLLGSLTDRANFNAPHLHTCSAGRDYLVFDAQGRISKCQMDMGHPITDSHDPDPLATVRISASGLQNPLVDKKDECRACPWRYWCGGGCPLLAFRTTGRYTTKSPYCNIYKAIFPEAIRLEGLRLIKYADVLSGEEP